MDSDDHAHPRHEVYDALNGDLRLGDELEVTRYEGAHFPARNVVVKGDRGELCVIVFFGGTAFTAVVGAAERARHASTGNKSKVRHESDNGGAHSPESTNRTT